MNFPELQKNPRNYTARLIYADWLEEHGETQKGQFHRWLGQNQIYPFMKEPFTSYPLYVLMSDSNPRITFPEGWFTDKEYNIVRIRSKDIETYMFKKWIASKDNTIVDIKEGDDKQLRYYASTRNNYGTVNHRIYYLEQVLNYVTDGYFIVINTFIDGYHIPVLDLDSHKPLKRIVDNLKRQDIGHAVYQSSTLRYWIIIDTPCSTFEGAYEIVNGFDDVDQQYLTLALEQRTFYLRAEINQRRPKLLYNACETVIARKFVRLFEQHWDSELVANIKKVRYG